MSSNNSNKGFVIFHDHCLGCEVDGKNDCHSSDALAVYAHDPDDNNKEEWYNASCFSCGQFFSKEQIYKSSLAEKLGVDGGACTTRKTFVRQPKAKSMEKAEVRALIKKHGYASNNYRGVKEDYNKFFGHLTELDPFGHVISQKYPETKDKGNYPVGYKIKYHPKAWNKVGLTGVNNELSGQVKFRNGGKYLFIVGGELDKVSAFQMLRDNQIARKQEDYDPIAVVSPTTGEGSAAKQVAKNYDFCDSFDIIVLGFDMDEAGQQANIDVANILPKEKVRIAKFGLKDPNEMLQKGKEKQFVRDFYSAKELVQSDIKHSTNALEEAREFITAEKIPLPPYLHRLQENMRGGIKSTGAIINIIGDTSIGKTIITDSLLYYWFWNSPIVPTIVSLERTTGELTLDFISMHLKNNLSWFKDGKDALKVIDDPKNEHLIQDLLMKDNGEARYHVLDERSGSPDSLKSCVERSYKQYGSRLIIFDPLTDFLRSLGTEAQEDFCMWQKQKKKEGIIFINVLHTRKPQADKEGKIRKVTEHEILGSGSFAQSADANIVINRDKMAEDEIERNTTCVDLNKIRGGNTGHACDIYYDYKTRQLHDKEDYFSEHGISLHEEVCNF